MSANHLTELSNEGAFITALPAKAFGRQSTLHTRKGRGRRRWEGIVTWMLLTGTYRTIPDGRSLTEPLPKASYVEPFFGTSHGQAPAHSLELVEKIIRDRLSASCLSVAGGGRIAVFASHAHGTAQRA